MIKNKIVNLMIMIFTLISVNIAGSIEFEKEADKSVWLKNFLKDKKFYLSFNVNYTKEEAAFAKELFDDFLTQTGITHIEPIAVGKSLDDPQIAPFNRACPDKKPITITREWPNQNNAPEDIPATEEELENEKYAVTVTQRRCTGNLKIYKFNVFNRSDNKQEHLLYCDNYRLERFQGEMLDLNEKEEGMRV